MHASRTVVVTCQTYLSRDVQTALKRLQLNYPDSHELEEALCALELLHAKLGAAASAVSDAEWRRLCAV
jgi:hypothetical protein